MSGNHVNNGLSLDDLMDDEQTQKLRELLDSDNEFDNNEEAILFSDDDEDYVDDNDESADDQENTGQLSKNELVNFGFSDEDDDVELSDSDFDEDFEFRNALREASNFKVKTKKGARRKNKGGLGALRRRIRRQESSPEVKQKLSEANEAFVRNDFQSAMDLYLDVVKLDNNNFSAYKTLGEIYRVQGNYNKCSNFWLLAAHIHPWDFEFWRTLAELSVELGHQRQALYCYTKAIRASHGKDLDSIFARACLYRERRAFKRATDSLIGLRSSMPQESKIIRELAKVYVDQNRINDAITMYNKVLEENMKHRRLTEKGETLELTTVYFDWSELNILCELYSSKAAWELGIKTLRSVSRWIQHRENQLFWDNNANLDVEFDARRFDYPKFQGLKKNEKEKDYTLPIDIRVQLGLFRLNSKAHREALKHFKLLLDYSVQEVSDLFNKVGTELEAFGLYSEALTFLGPLSTDAPEYNTPELVLAVAKCLRETEQFQSAKEAYLSLLEYDPDNLEVKVGLAEVCFYLNEVDLTSKLYKEVKEQRKREKATARANLLKSKDGDIDVDEHISMDEDDSDHDDEFDDDAFSQRHQALIAEFPSSKKAKKKKSIVLTENELKTMEEKSATRVKQQYFRACKILKKLESLSGYPKKHKAPIASVWIDLVSELIELFSTYRCFFSSDRAKKFNINLRKRTARLNVDQKLSRMTYLQNEIILSNEMMSGKIPLPEDEFKGISYDDWYDLFMSYSLMIAEYEDDVDDAVAVQEIAKHINVFQNKEAVTSMVGLSVGVIARDSSLVLSQSRNLMNDYQFSSLVYKTFLASCYPDIYMYGHYADPAEQKYLLRQVKAYDGLKTGKEISGMATISNRNVDINGEHPVLSYLYSSYLYINKSYYSALIYALKIYREYDNDPALLLLIALCNFHRCVQRQTLNTNFQLLQGLTYLLEYIKKTGVSDIYNRMETTYNMGRAFHMFGLDNLAIQFYEAVLKIEVEDSRFDLKKEAAYNLYQIYNVNCNYKLAEKIMDEYLVI